MQIFLLQAAGHRPATLEPVRELFPWRRHALWQQTGHAPGNVFAGNKGV
jgi:hypothetical protein